LTVSFFRSIAGLSTTSTGASSLAVSGAPKVSTAVTVATFVTSPAGAGPSQVYVEGAPAVRAPRSRAQPVNSGSATRTSVTSAPSRVTVIRKVTGSPGRTGPLTVSLTIPIDGTGAERAKPVAR
jgi:hypothetical protein